MSTRGARNLIPTIQFLLISAIIIIISAAIPLFLLYEVDNGDHIQLMAQQQQPMKMTTERNLNDSLSVNILFM
jgi:hypothetical protein